MTKKAEKQAEYADALKQLRKLFKPGARVAVVLKHVSRSGMSRSIAVLASEGGRVFDASWLVARLGFTFDQHNGGVKVGGCGMDMGFHLVYSMSRMMYPKGFGLVMTKEGARNVRPQSAAHAARLVSRGYVSRGRNGDTSGWDNDGGYALRSEWV